VKPTCLSHFAFLVRWSKNTICFSRSSYFHLHLYRSIVSSGPMPADLFIPGRFHPLYIFCPIFSGCLSCLPHGFSLSSLIIEQRFFCGLFSYFFFCADPFKFLAPFGETFFLPHPRVLKEIVPLLVSKMCSQENFLQRHLSLFAFLYDPSSTFFESSFSFSPFAPFPRKVFFFPRTSREAIRGSWLASSLFFTAAGRPPSFFRFCPENRRFLIFYRVSDPFFSGCV